MAPNNVRLNYTISRTTDDMLTSYCEITGRTASDVVRQLVSEILEDDRQVPSKARIEEFLRNGERRDRRTDMWISPQHLAALDEKLEAEGYSSKSIVISCLLHEFLSARSNHAREEMVRVTTLIDRLTYTRLAVVASQQKQSVEGLIADMCKHLVDQFETKD